MGFALQSLFPSRSVVNNLLVNLSIFAILSIHRVYTENLIKQTIKIEVKARTTKKFDRTWINGVIEEPLDELNIKASTRLE